MKLLFEDVNLIEGHFMMFGTSALISREHMSNHQLERQPRCLHVTLVVLIVAGFYL